jgi:hypothetical protein
MGRLQGRQVGQLGIGAVAQPIQENHDAFFRHVWILYLLYKDLEKHPLWPAFGVRFDVGII